MYIEAKDGARFGLSEKGYKNKEFVEFSKGIDRRGKSTGDRNTDFVNLMEEVNQFGKKQSPSANDQTPENNDPPLNSGKDMDKQENAEPSIDREE